MNWKESYNDICAELRIVQIHEMEIRRRVELAQRRLSGGAASGKRKRQHGARTSADELPHWADTTILMD